MLKYSFYKKKIWPDKPEYKLIAVLAPYEALSDISNGFLSKPEGVEKVIREIESVQSGGNEEYFFDPSDFCVLSVSTTTTTVTSTQTGEEEIFDVSTSDIKQLLVDWKNYLLQG
jgi:hypothetical protein